MIPEQNKFIRNRWFLIIFYQDQLVLKFMNEIIIGFGELKFHTMEQLLGLMLLKKNTSDWLSKKRK